MKNLIKPFLSLVGVMIAIGLIFCAIFFACGVFVFDNGIMFNADLFNAVRGKWWLYIVFVILQLIITILLSFIPFTSMAFITLSIILFPNSLSAFLVSFIGVMISSLIMDLLGRFGGYKVIKHFVDKNDLDTAQKLVKNKGKVWLPIMYLFPIFPDDAICMVAGMSKINFLLHTLYIFICRGIGVATIVYGVNLIPFETFTTLYDYVVLGGVLVAYVSLMFKIAMFIDKKINRKEN